MAASPALAYSYSGDITKLRSVIAAAEADLAAPGVSVRDRLRLPHRQVGPRRYFSGAFAAAEARRRARTEENASALDQMGP